MHFITGDAIHLPFDDNSFDFVYTRYLLHHIPDAFAAMSEMKRVCRKGGMLFAEEPDAHFLQSYPESWAYPRMPEFINKLFSDAQIGRRMIYYFRKLTLKDTRYRAEAMLADHNASLEKFYRMISEALRESILQKNWPAKEKLMNGLLN